MYVEPETSFWLLFQIGNQVKSFSVKVQIFRQMKSGNFCLCLAKLFRPPNFFLPVRSCVNEYINECA